jgi:ParB family chromosome partitioning protein
MTTLAATDIKRRALGKGLDSLLPRAQSAPAPEAEGGKPREIALDLIEPNPFQTRSQVNEEQLAELAASITSNGVVQPILLRPLAGGRFQLIAGERRWRASRLAGKTTVPAILRQVSDEQAMEITIVENLQRADLNPMAQEQMAQRTGKDRATVANFLRLLRLPSSVQSRVESGQLTFGHARALLAFEHAEEIEKAAQRIASLSLSVRQTETYVQSQLDPNRNSKKEPKPVPQVDPNVRDAQERLQRSLGLKVYIEDKNGRGKVVIEYGRLEDFDALMEKLTGE